MNRRAVNKRAMNGRSRGSAILLLRRSLVCLAVGFVGCGGGDGATKPPKLEGPFAQVVGASSATFSLAATDAEVECIPKPGLEEFEYTATDAATGNGLHLVLKEYTGPGAFELEYGVTNPKHEIVLTLAGGFKYHFFQHMRTDSDEIFVTHCHLALTAEEGQQTTRYAGHLNCTLLWADVGSPDYAGSSRMNNFVDLVARFECER